MKITGLVMMTALVLLAAISVAHAETNLCYEYSQQKQYDEAIRECTRQIELRGNSGDIIPIIGLIGHQCLLAFV